MSSSRRNKNDRRIFVGNINPDMSRGRDLEDVFNRFGRINDITLFNGSDKFQRTLFAFVEFEDPRDARDAVDRRDGYYYMGRKLRVEFPKGDRDRDRSFGAGRDRGDRDRSFGAGRDRGDRDRSIGTGPDRSDRDRGDHRPRGNSFRRTKYRVRVAGLPSSASWQDLKDHMRDAGKVTFAEVFKDGTGRVEFTRFEDMRYAVKHLEDSKFKSHEGDTAYISVKEDYEDDHRSRSKSKSKRRSRSRSPPRYRRQAYPKTPSPVAARSALPDSRRRR